MCIALPMKVLESGPMMVVCERNGRRLEVDCSMIDRVMAGDVDDETIRSGFGDLIDRGPELPEHLRALVGRAPGKPL